VPKPEAHLLALLAPSTVDRAMGCTHIVLLPHTILQSPSPHLPFHRHRVLNRSRKHETHLPKCSTCKCQEGERLIPLPCSNIPHQTRLALLWPLLPHHACNKTERLSCCYMMVASLPTSFTQNSDHNKLWSSRSLCSHLLHTSNGATCRPSPLGTSRFPERHKQKHLHL
jgi:hypothetical protein